MEKVFPTDVLSKRERVERALRMQPVDRTPIHEQLSNAVRVIPHYAQRPIRDYEYGFADIGRAVQACLDCTFPIVEPLGTGIETTEDGFRYQLDNWTKWHLSRPFEDEAGAAEWLKGRTELLRAANAQFDPEAERERYRAYMLGMQQYVGETVIMDWSITTGFCDVFDKMGLEIFSYFIYDYDDVMEAYMEQSGTLAARRAAAVGDYELSPVVLIAEDFCTKQGPIFSPELLRRFHYPWVKALTDAWHSRGLKVIYHTDGNFKLAIPDLMECGVDGFYCLERNCHMHVEQLAAQYPNMVWMGGVDGVNTMEFGTPEDVKKEVRQIIRETKATERGGVFIDSSSEINPPISFENFRAMLESCEECRNPNFILGGKEHATV